MTCLTPRTPARSPPPRPASRSSLLCDFLFLFEYNVRFLGTVVLFTAGVGLLLRKRWGRSLSVGWAIGITGAYFLMWIAGGRFSFELNAILPGMAILLAAGLLWITRWDPLLSMIWMMGVIGACFLMNAIDRNYPLALLGFLGPLNACAYPIALLMGMYHPNVMAACRHTSGTTHHHSGVAGSAKTASSVHASVALSGGHHLVRRLLSDRLVDEAVSRST